MIDSHQCTYFTSSYLMQVMADERLAKRLLLTPMLATVLLHPCTKQGDMSPQPVPIGTAQMDLSTLLKPR